MDIDCDYQQIKVYFSNVKTYKSYLVSDYEVFHFSILIYQRYLETD